MPADPNDLSAPPPTPEDVARFCQVVADLDAELNSHFGGQIGKPAVLLAMGSYAESRLQALGYRFRCTARATGWGEYGRNVTIDLQPRTLHDGRLYILWCETIGARVVVP